MKEVGDRYLQHVEHVLERKPSTVQDYRIMLDRHFEPHFSARGIDKLGPDDVTGYMHAKASRRLSSETICNHSDAPPWDTGNGAERWCLRPAAEPARGAA